MTTPTPDQRVVVTAAMKCLAMYLERPHKMHLTVAYRLLKDAVERE